MAKILIGCPTHAGDLSAQTFHSITTTHSCMGHEVSFNVIGLSLLARNFSTLFLSAFNNGYDYFFLHHADIGFAAESNSLSWLDLMVQRIEELQAAALSVVSPIKNEAGHTSTGLIMDKNNVYNLRRVTIKELELLPKPFISRSHICKLFDVDPDVAGALLVNTAGLLMDLKGYDWTKWPGFEIRDEIIWNKSSYGTVRTIPEDWNMSAWMHENGFPFYATKEIAAHHIGQKDWTNYGSRGYPTDDQKRECPREEWESSTEPKRKTDA